MERVELVLYLLGLAKRHSLFLLAGECVGFKFESMDAHTHPFSYLSYLICLVTHGYHSRKAVLDMLLGRDHAVKFLGG